MTVTETSADLLRFPSSPIEQQMDSTSVTEAGLLAAATNFPDLNPALMRTPVNRGNANASTAAAQRQPANNKSRGGMSFITPPPPPPRKTPAKRVKSPVRIKSPIRVKSPPVYAVGKKSSSLSSSSSMPQGQTEGSSSHPNPNRTDPFVHASLLSMHSSTEEPNLLVSASGRSTSTSPQSERDGASAGDGGVTLANGNAATAAPPAPPMGGPPPPPPLPPVTPGQAAMTVTPKPKGDESQGGAGGKSGLRPPRNYLGIKEEGGRKKNAAKLAVVAVKKKTDSNSHLLQELSLRLTSRRRRISNHQFSIEMENGENSPSSANSTDQSRLSVSRIKPPAVLVKNEFRNSMLDSSSTAPTSRIPRLSNRS
jgi:hypothetical protein